MDFEVALIFWAIVLISILWCIFRSVQYFEDQHDLRKEQIELLKEIKNKTK
jgi:hypothetical protein